MAHGFPMRQLSIAASAEPNGPGFVLEVEGQAVLALAAGNLWQAKKLCAEPWFLDELSQYQSVGAPICPVFAAPSSKIQWNCKSR